MYSAHLSGSNHRAEGGQPGENQREDFTDVPKDVRTDGDKMGMSGPKGRASGGGVPRFTPAPRNRIKEFQ